MKITGISFEHNREQAVEHYVRTTFLKGKQRCPEIVTTLLDAEKKRTFLVQLGSRKIFVKIDLRSWEGEDRSHKMVNERLALRLLAQKKIAVVPRIYRYDRKHKLFGEDVLCTEYITDTKRKITTKHIEQLVAQVEKIHAIQSKKFTVAFGPFKHALSGNGYDFINVYRKALASDIRKTQTIALVHKLEFSKIFRDSLQFITAKIKQHKDIFQATKQFSLIHGHLARHKERKHILIDKDDRVYIIDWENVCFGEPELEMAAFIYENYSLSQRLKKLFVTQYSRWYQISQKKISIYCYLIKLDDSIEDFKRRSFLLKQKVPVPIDKQFIISVNKQKQLLMSLKDII